MDKKKLTELTLKDGWFCGAGISVKVFFESLKKENNLIFLSEIEGNYGDNLYILVLAKPQAKSLTLTRHKNPGPIAKQYGEPFQQTEFMIPEKIKSQYKTNTKQHLKDYFGDIENGIIQSFYIHDNCFFSNYPLNNESYKRFINSILQVHSYYHKQKIEWEYNVISLILKMLKKHQTIEVRSNNLNTTTISYKVPNENAFTKIFKKNKKISIDIIIKNGVATIKGNSLNNI